MVGGRKPSKMEIRIPGFLLTENLKGRGSTIGLNQEPSTKGHSKMVLNTGEEYGAIQREANLKERMITIEKMELESSSGVVETLTEVSFLTI